MRRRPNDPNPRSVTSNSTSSSPSPLNYISHTARFDKLYSKSGPQFSENLIPLLFQATHQFPLNSITACLYSNQFWLDRLPSFVQVWDGPISLVLETLTNDRIETIQRIERLRESDPSISHRVDVHLLSTPTSSTAQRFQNLERMLVEPIATNAQLNLARFFSPSDLVWLVGDARVIPSPELYRVLSSYEKLERRVLDYGDALIIPNFALARHDLPLDPPNLSSVNSGSDLHSLAQEYIHRSFSSILLPVERWPRTTDELLSLTSERIDDRNSAPKLITMWDPSWEPNQGPTNWTMWQRFTATGGISGRTTSEIETEARRTTVGEERGKPAGGKNELYPIVDYDLTYAPNVIVSREGQPWCTERFEFNKAACIYQMYLTGTELWVMPAAWSLTVQEISTSSGHRKARWKDENKVLRDLISSRLYTKFHQEACMHYGREISSVEGGWEDDRRSKHARAICINVLNSWGVGVGLSSTHETLIIK